MTRSNRPRPDPMLRMGVKRLIELTRGRRPDLSISAVGSLIAEVGLDVVAAVDGEPAAHEEGYRISDGYTGSGREMV